METDQFAFPSADADPIGQIGQIKRTWGHDEQEYILSLSIGIDLS